MSLKHWQNILHELQNLDIFIIQSSEYWEQSIQTHFVSIACSRHSKLSEPDLFSMSEKFQLKRQNPKFPKINMNHIIPKIQGRIDWDKNICEYPPSVQVINHSHDILSGPWLNEWLKFSFKFKSKTKTKKRNLRIYGRRYSPPCS